MKRQLLWGMLGLFVACSNGSNDGGSSSGSGTSGTSASGTTNTSSGSSSTASAGTSAGTTASGSTGTNASGTGTNASGTGTNASDTGTNASSTGTTGTGTTGGRPNTSSTGDTSSSTSATGSSNTTTAGSTNTTGATSSGTTSGTTGGTTGGTTSGDDSVLERNHHPSRDGLYVQPMLTKAAAATMAADANFKATFSGNMWASPLYLQNGPNGKGLFFAVTTGNDVFAIDETTGATVWTKNIGSSPTMNGVNCGSIHPLGIISTPVIDPTTRTIYVAGAVGTTAITSHQVHALNVDDGTERAGWPVDVTKLMSGGVQFTPAPQNQRSALSLVNGTLYVAYGGHVGDCGNYHGWVVGINTADPTKIGGWPTLGQGEGIWAPGGLASDGNGVFAITGNSTVRAADRTVSDSEAVVRITGLGTLNRQKDIFYPSTWKTMDQQDADLGANNPVYITVPGSTPANYVAAISKDGHLFLLDPMNFGGMDGAKVDFSVASGAMAIHTAPGAYTTSKGVHVVFSTDSGANCPAGGASGKVVISVLIGAGSPPKPQVEWCAPLSGSVTGPAITTTDGMNNAIVWYMNNNKLNAVDGDTGQSVFAGTDSCTVRMWTSPIAVKGRIVVGGDGHLCSWSSH